MSAEEFWNRKASLPGFNGVVTNIDPAINTQLLISYLSTKFNFENETILDIGCGVGRLFSLYLEMKAKEVHGIDISLPMLRIARLKFPQSNIFLHHKDVTTGISEIFKQKKFSLILCINVLSHILDDTSLTTVYNDMKHLLSEEGFLVICDPTSFSLTEEFKHSHLKLRPLSQYVNALVMSYLDLVSRSDILLGPLEYIDSRQSMIVFYKAKNHAILQGQ